ncbi:MAG: hypothetical protein ACLTW6_10140 [Enterobacter sp.]
MQWKIINGWYCVTACGLMSTKCRTLHEGHQLGISSPKMLAM